MALGAGSVSAQDFQTLARQDLHGSAAAGVDLAGHHVVQLLVVDAADEDVDLELAAGLAVGLLFLLVYRRSQRRAADITDALAPPSPPASAPSSP